MKRYKVIQDYTSPYPDPILFHAGEPVQVGEKSADDPDWNDWYWCEGQRQQKAWVPVQYLQLDGSVGVFIREYNARELSLQTGEILTAYEEINGFCMAEKENGQKGWAPLNHLEMLSEN